MNQPHLIIMPTEDAVTDFLADVRNMTNHDYDMGEIIKDVFKTLAFLPESIAAINSACEGIVASYVRADARDDGLVLANGFGNLAHKVRDILIKGDAWDSSGILRVRYKDAVSDNWILELDDNKFDPFEAASIKAAKQRLVDTVKSMIRYPDTNPTWNPIIPETTGAWLIPTDNYGGKIVGKPICISSKEEIDFNRKVNNENNPE